MNHIHILLSVLGSYILEPGPENKSRVTGTRVQSGSLTLYMFTQNNSDDLPCSSMVNSFYVAFQQSVSVKEPWPFTLCLSECLVTRVTCWKWPRSCFRTAAPRTSRTARSSSPRTTLATLQCIPTGCLNAYSPKPNSPTRSRLARRSFALPNRTRQPERRESRRLLVLPEGEP